MIKQQDARRQQLMLDMAGYQCQCDICHLELAGSERQYHVFCRGCGHCYIDIRPADGRQDTSFCGRCGTGAPWLLAKPLLPIFPPPSPAGAHVLNAAFRGAEGGRD